jgi:hypothetical protein
MDMSTWTDAEFALLIRIANLAIQIDSITIPGPLDGRIMKGPLSTNENLLAELHDTLQELKTHRAMQPEDE